MIRIGGNGRFHPPEEGKANDPDHDFPMEDTYKDFAGKARKFEIKYMEVGLGHTVTAEEVGKRGMGYEFSAFDPHSPYLALGRVRAKIERALSTRHLHREGREVRMGHDELKGRISYSEKDDSIAFIVDGQPLSPEQIVAFARGREGWDFVLRFVDPGE